MKNILFSVAICIAFISCSSSKLVTSPTKNLEFRFKQESGTNGCAVAYNPSKGLYYITIAGNTEYPLEVFNANGVNLYQTKSGYDARGLWYNDRTKTLQGNGYPDGVYSISLDAKGFPLEPKALTDNQVPPSAHASGAFDNSTGEIFFYNEGKINKYDAQTYKSTGSVILSSISQENINKTGVIYTGVKDKEYGILDYTNNTVLLFDKIGNLTGTVNIPSTQATKNMFWFSYANKHVFLYDSETRTWTGYKIFK